jgi:hypothetical protein
MAFIDFLETKINAAYMRILSEKYHHQVNGKTLNCDSFHKIAIEVMTLINDAQSNEITTALGIANHIIFNLLKKDYFVYDNNIMSAFIGHLFLENRNVTHRFSVGNITNTSTLSDITSLTARW